MEIRAVRQQGINPAGDCGPCCLSGITGKSVRKIYDLFGRVDGLSYYTMKNMLKILDLKYDDKLPYLDDWRNDAEWQAFGRPSYMLSHEWLQNAYTQIHKGAVGLCQVHIDGKGYEQEHINHWVIVYRVKFDHEGMYKDDNVFISCPTKGEYSINVKHFLKYYGGYNALWVWPTIPVSEKPLCEGEKIKSSSGHGDQHVS